MNPTSTIRTARVTCIRSCGHRPSSSVSRCSSSNLSKRLLIKTNMARWRATPISHGIPRRSSPGRISCMSMLQSGGQCSSSVSSRCQMLSETSLHFTLNTCSLTWCGRPTYTRFTKCTTRPSALTVGRNGSSSSFSWSHAWLQNRDLRQVVRGLCTSLDQTTNTLTSTYILPSSTFLTGLNMMSAATLAKMTIIITHDNPLQGPFMIKKLIFL